MGDGLTGELRSTLGATFGTEDPEACQTQCKTVSTQCDGH